MKRFPVILAPALLGSLLMLGGCATTGPNTAPLPPDRDCQEVYTVAPGNYIIDMFSSNRKADCVLGNSLLCKLRIRKLTMGC